MRGPHHGVFPKRIENLSIPIKMIELNDWDFLKDFEKESANIVGAFFSILGSAVASGLTIGMMSMDSFDLLVLCETNAEEYEEHERDAVLEEQKHAARLLPLVGDHHRLLVTLLTMNALCAEALPVFLDQIVSPTVAVLLSVSFVLVFGEIIPSSLFTGPAGLKIASTLSPFVRLILVIFAPVAIPIGKFLDWWVGEEESATYKTPELRALLRLHTGQTVKQLTYRQSKMMEGVR